MSSIAQVYTFWWYSEFGFFVVLIYLMNIEIHTPKTHLLCVYRPIGAFSK
jgi:hypothetical protein